MRHKKSATKSPRKQPPQKQGGGNNRIPEICVLLVSATSENGDLIGVPATWESHKQPPHIVLTESGRGQAASVGDRVLAKMRKIEANLYQALVIRVLETEVAHPVIGVFVPTGEGGIIEPVSRKLKESFMVAKADTNGALHGELVSGVTLPGVPSMGMTFAKITERLGRVDSPKAASQIAAAIHNLPSVFSREALDQAEAAPFPTLTKDRTDLRHIPLVTIDGADARDFDDAVFAEPDGDGFHLVVAIAEVAFYVPEGSALDKCAFERGNSVYFPDRVIPMLPERLSNGLCSLNPNEDRYCLAVHIWINSVGEIKKYEFVRGLMKSVARLTYEEVESARLQVASDKENTNLATCHLQLATLWQAYAALATERDRRGALNLNLPEYKIKFGAAGNVENIIPRLQLESHRLIECFMIAANVAAADFLLKKKAPGIYRVHEAPSEEKLDEVRMLLKMSGYGLQKGAVTAAHFNRVLKASENQPDRLMVNTAVLRAQMQAYYSLENLGHFGLGLQKYCHFTSPIRRYSDLVVHRSLAHLLSGEKAPPHKHLAQMALHISDTERKAMMAERDASDRYKVSYMSHQLGNVFSGAISGLNEYGLFITLPETGVTGFVPVRNLGHDFFQFDRRSGTFKGQRSKQEFSLGIPMMVKVMEANAMTGSLIFAPEGVNVNMSAPLRPKHGHHRPHKDSKHRPKGGHKGKKPHKKKR